MISRLLQVLVTAFVVMVGLFAVPAGAQYGGTATITLDVAVASPSSPVTITVTDCEGSAGQTVPIFIDGVQVGTGTYDANGSFTQTVTVPSVAQGVVPVTVGCGADVLETQLEVRIGDLPFIGDDGGSTTGGTLPFTGTSSTGILVQVGMALIGFGALLVFVVPRRRKQQDQKSAAAAH